MHMYVYMYVYNETTSDQVLRFARTIISNMSIICLKNRSIGLAMHIYVRGIITLCMYTLGDY